MAEKFLKQSIIIFDELNKKEARYAICMAAAYNYLGEIRRHNMQFPEANTYYRKALQISEDKKVCGSLAVFYTNAGQASYDGGNYLQARRYLDDAIDMYNTFETLWGRSTAEGYKALLLIEDGQYTEALSRVEHADLYSQKLQSPYEIGLVFMVKAEIKHRMSNNRQIKRVFSHYLDLPLTEYCDKGIDLLKNVKESYEIGKLIALRDQHNSS